jgi:hypothetical protein
VAEASPSSPAPAGRTGLTAGRRGSGFPARPRNCAQRGCTGTIVDGYCDVCGSPVGALPFIPAVAAAEQPNVAEEESPTQRIPRVQMTTELPSAQEMADPAAADPEESPTQRIPRVKVPTGLASAQMMADQAAADHPALDAQKFDGENALAEDQPDGAQDYRTRVEGAELPDDVRKAALGEVDKLERTSDQSPDSGEIRIWLDTILDLPWSTKTTDWIDIQGSREVEATLRRLIEPAAGDVKAGDSAEVEAVPGHVEGGDSAEVEAVPVDVEEGDTAEVEAAPADTEKTDTAKVDPAPVDVEGGDSAEVEAVPGHVEEGDTAEVDPAIADTAKVDPAIADTEKADTAPAGPYDDDTVETPAVLAGFSGRRHSLAQPPEQEVDAPAPGQNPAGKRRSGSLAVAAITLAALLIGAFFIASRDVGGVTAQPDATVTATATMPVGKPPSERSNEPTGTGSGSVAKETIQLEDLAASARPFEAVRIQGTYRGGAGSFLRVQRWDGGKWLDFPLPTKTDQSGQFITQAEFGQPGSYRLRVLDPDSGVTSEPFVVVIKG